MVTVFDHEYSTFLGKVQFSVYTPIVNRKIPGLEVHSISLLSPQITLGTFYFGHLIQLSVSVYISPLKKVNKIVVNIYS